MRNLEMVALELEELMASKAIIEAKIEAARNEIIRSIEADKLTLLKVGKFTINLRNDKVWTYSKWVRTLEKMLVLIPLLVDDPLWVLPHIRQHKI
jgi:hypothetical protein